MRYSNLLSPLALLTLVCLTGCSGEPSESDIQTAIKSEMDKSVQDADKFAGNMGSSMMKDMLPTIYGVHKIGCTKDQGASYTCDVEVDASTTFSGRKKAVTKMTLVKGSDGWVLQK